MKPVLKSSLLAVLLIGSVVFVGCSGAGWGGVTSTNNSSSSSGSGSGSGTGSGTGSGSGSGSTTATYTIGGSVTGLATGSNGLVLQDNGGNNLTVTANSTFTFTTAISSGKPYTVTLLTEPTSPAQTCTVVNGNGDATANVTNVQVTCSTGTVSIGGNVIGLLGIGLTLQDNGGDSLTVPVSGPFTFKTAIPIGNMYAVTVSAQPTSPVQTCTVTYGSGTATTNVNTVQITCSTGTISIGGTVAGLSKTGSGLVLQDNGGDNLTVTSNGSFTFPTLVSSNAAYNVTILTQPAGPNQVCTVTNGSGNATADVTNVQIICPAIFHSIGGTVVGLVGTDAGMVLQDNLGDNLTVNSNGPFTFNTPLADGTSYYITILVGPSTQPGVGCVTWGYEGTATANVTSVIIDCGHNDWAWFDGSSTANSNGQFNGPPTGSTPTFDTDTPGGRNYPATWTDYNGNLWLFGGYGLTYLPGYTPPATTLNDGMWEYTGTSNYFGSYGNYWNNFTPASGPSARQGSVTWTQPGSGGDLYMFGGEDGAGDFLGGTWKYNIAGNTWTKVGGGSESVNQAGTYLALGTPGGYPGSRWGATAKIDANGTVWMFGGYGYDSMGNLGLLNDLWTYNITLSQWTWVGGSEFINQIGSYGTIGTSGGVPGARQAAMCWIDGSGNFWLFGGFDLDSNGHPDALNDLWEFTAGSPGTWTWKSGAKVVNQVANYGTQGVAASTNVPGAAWSGATWTDANGNLWLFGGEGYDSTADGSLADTWEWTNGGWIWQKGPGSVDQAGVYGLTPGPIIYPYVGNYPGSRFAPGFWIIIPANLNQTIWASSNGAVQFWMFGGEGFDSTGTSGDGLLDDLWRYVPYP